MNVQVVFFIILSFCGLPADSFTVCAKSKYHQEECNLIKNHKWECLLVENIIDCLEKLNDGVVDLALVTHEEADLVAQNLTNLAIVGEVRAIEAQYDESEFNLTVLTSRNITKFSDLKELNICHPGYDKIKVPPYMLYTFEPEILQRCKSTDCYSNADRDLLEKLCIPSEQAQDFSYELCGNNCPEIGEPFHFSMNCLSSGKGDVAVTTLNLVNDRLQPGNINFLTTNGVTSSNPVTWRRKLWPMIVSNMKNVDTMIAQIEAIFPEKIINSELFPDEQEQLNSILSTIVLSSQSDKILMQKPNVKRKLNEFLEDNGAELIYYSGDDSIGWCTSSINEEKKCNWLSQVTRKFITIQNVRCVLKEDCWEAFKNNDTDVDVFSTFKTNITEIDFNPGFDIIKAMTTDSDANWTLVMRSKNKSNVKNILNVIIKLFAGTNSYKPFVLFGKYRNESNLLFPDTTFGFDYESVIDKKPDVMGDQWRFIGGGSGLTAASLPLTYTIGINILFRFFNI